MSFKLVLLVSFLALAAAIEIHQHSHEEEGPAEYEFSYSVHDEHTGDIKSQKEVRKGDKVEGIYTLIDSDGHRRVVQYRSDKHSGFEALVHREPTDIKIPIPETRHKLVAHKILTPLVHHTPIHSLNFIRSEHGSHGSEGGESTVSVSSHGASYKY